jgi:6-phosphogluconolactonase
MLTFADRDELAAALAEKVAAVLYTALGITGRAVLVVSGGTTPAPFFRRLAEKDIPWQKITVTLADERWVDTDHPDSNEKLVRTHLLQGPARTAGFVGLKNESPTAAAGEKEACRRLAELPAPFAAVVLGMGSDGHTASLFPGAPQLAQALDREASTPCLAVDPADAAHGRITLALPALLKTRRIFLHITGMEKLEILKRALAGGPVEEMPVRSVILQEETPVEIYWAP